MELKNWETKLESVKTCLRCWNVRDLSLQGRILVIKTLALAKVVYSTAAICTPNWVVNTLNKEFYSFVWRYKRDKIARKVILNDIDKGGLNMIDFRSFSKSMKAVWASKIYNSKDETWAIIPNKYFESCGIGKLSCMNAESEKHIPFQLPPFYKDIIHS